MSFIGQPWLLRRPLPAPSLDLNFLATTLDPRITFTRAAGPATYFDSTGTAQTAGTNVARFDYDPVTRAARGPLIEEARTNSIRNSTMVGAAAGTPGTLPNNWVGGSTGGLTVNVIGTGTETGIAYVDIQWVGTATGTSVNMPFESNGIIPATQNQSWTLSFYQRLVGGSLANVTAPLAEAFELNSGGSLLTVPQVAVAPATAAALASQRVSGTFVLPSATAAFIRPLFQFFVTNGAAINFTLRIGAPQLELGTFPTSFVPTTAAAATRAADVVTMPVGSWFNASAGALLFEYDSAKSGSGVIGGMSDGTFGNSFYGSQQATTVAWNGPGFGSSTSSGLLNALGKNNKSAVSYQRGSVAVFLNGYAPVSTTLGAGPYPWTSNLSLGCSPWGLDNQIGGHIRRVRYWPRALGANELQVVTR